MAYSKGTVLPMHFSWFFWLKYIVRRVMEACKSETPCFLCRSLLLSTTTVVMANT